MARILIAEDDPKQAEVIRRYVVAEGHAATLVRSGRDAVDEVRHEPPDLLVLDVMMPGMDGLDVCRVLRADAATRDLPILVLTARAAEEDMLLGFDLGADDYLTKPYSPRELMARARALLRRAEAAGRDADRPLVVGDLAVAPTRHEVTFRGVPVECTAAELALLEVFAGEPDRVFSREQLLRRLHGIDRYVTRRTIDVHVVNLRKKLDPALIRTVYGVGYALASAQAAR